MDRKLSNLEFSDLYITKDPTLSWYKQTPDSTETPPVPVEFHPDLLSLRAILEARHTKPDSRLMWDGMPLRVGTFSTVDDVVFVCRNFNKQGFSSLSDLGFPTPIMNDLLDSKLKNGLVLYVGKTGSGKTTCATTYLIERLKKRGGVAWTIENPVEIPLNGRHGRGNCYQMEVNDDAEFGPQIKRLVRASPNLLLVGEIRTAEAAREVVLAAAGGMLVITTFHASSLLVGLSRFSELCKERDLLAISLRAIFYLQLESSTEVMANLPGMSSLPGSSGPMALPGSHLPGKTVIPEYSMNIESLMLTGAPNNVLTMQNAIRENAIGNLTSDIRQQRDTMMVGRRS